MSVSLNNNSEKAVAVIGPMVWGSLVQRLRLYEVVNVEISPTEKELKEPSASHFWTRLRSFVFSGKFSSEHQTVENKPSSSRRQLRMDPKIGRVNKLKDEKA